MCPSAASNLHGVDLSVKGRTKITNQADVWCSPSFFLTKSAEIVFVVVVVVFYGRRKIRSGERRSLMHFVKNKRTRAPKKKAVRSDDFQGISLLIKKSRSWL